jgi:hypothetical protein
MTASACRPLADHNLAQGEDFVDVYWRAARARRLALEIRVSSEPDPCSSPYMAESKPDHAACPKALLLWQARRMNIVLDGSTHISSMR